MRLLNVKTLKLEDRSSIKRGRLKYAILSHTWLEEEVLFHHIENLEPPALEKLKGYAKVKDSCAQAETDGYEYIWIDTCCIDKSSSAELSEAINSMWTWYRQSDICYGYLADVKGNDRKALYRSRWFQRGWTLQELIAPDNFIFYDMNWQEMGRRERLVSLISDITGVDEDVLSRNLAHRHSHDIQPRNSLCAVCGLPESIDEILRTKSVASKMSWSAHRKTTRGEDRSYSLLGLFGVNLPLLYGEGEAAAWRRLLDEIIKKSNDQSVFAFDYYPERGHEYTYSGMPVTLTGGGIYAYSARQYTKNIQLLSSTSTKTMGFVAGDLVLEIWLCPLIPKDTSKWTLQKTYGDTYAGLLECKVTGDSLAWPVMILKSVAGSDNKFIRRPSNLLKIDMEGPATFKACRDPRAGETTRLGSIAEDCIYDINKAELRRITIIDHGQQEGFFVNTINHVTKPLQITPVVQSDDFHYKLDSSYPESRNGNIGTIPVFWGQDFMGMAIFSNNNRYPFVVTWGPGQSRGTRPWCKLFTLGKADPSKYEAEKDHLARAIRDSAWKEQEHKSLRLKDFKVNFETVRDKDAVAFGNVYITIKIRDVKVLDREIWQLTIEVKPLARNRLVEKTMMETSEGIRSDADKK